MFLFNFIWSICYSLLFLIVPIVFYSLFCKNSDLLTSIKYYISFCKIKQIQTNKRKQIENINIEQLDEVNKVNSYNVDIITLYGIDQNGNYLFINFTQNSNSIATVNLVLELTKLNTTYTLKSCQFCRTTKLQWKLKTLLIEILEPFKRYRVVFNGLLYNCTNNSNEHVRFNFIFNCASMPKWYPQDTSTTLLAEALAQTPWKSGQWADVLDFGSTNEQFGLFCGLIKVQNTEITLNLPSCRIRYQGLTDKIFDREFQSLITAEDGTLINLYIKRLHSGLEIKSGYVIFSDSTIQPVTYTDINLNYIAPHKNIPQLINIYVKSPKKGFHCVLHLKNDFEIDNSFVINAECDFNYQQAKAILILRYNSKGIEIEQEKEEEKLANLLLKSTIKDKSKDLLVNLRDEKAKNVELSGGKGASLAQLSAIETDMFLVPEGFVVTVNAFDEQLKYSPIVHEVITTLSDIWSGKKAGNLEEACDHTVNIIKNQKISPKIIEVITKELTVLNKNGDRWAVRSSATEEDTFDLSAAGQNETFLGCKTIDSVLISLKACWASLFTYQSIQYRKQHGLKVQSKMAVVVQKMVPSDSSGVLFTCHPTTGNPQKIVITSNFGLGESVVSGHVEPDTIIIDRNGQEIKIAKKQMGLKQKIVQMSDDGTELIDLKENKFSLTDDEALKLAKIGCILDEIFENFWDIEFSLYQGTTYLLQMRPITTLNSWTNFELLHEFDDPILTEKNYFTKANIGEVLPGSCSILTQTTTAPAIDRAYQLKANKTVNYYIKANLIAYQHQAFINVLNGIHNRPSKNGLKIEHQLGALAVFGHEALTNEMNELSLKRFGAPSQLSEILYLFEMVTSAWNNEKTIKKMIEQNKNMQININENDNLIEIYKKIDKYIKNLDSMSYYHLTTSSVSVFYQIMSISILLEGSTELKHDHYTDISLLLSSCGDVLSAEIPVKLENIANKLREIGLSEEFLKIETNKAIEWLKETSPEIYQLFNDFLKLYGHRALAEMDIGSETWDLNPNLIIEMIKVNCKNPNRIQKKQRQLSIEEIIDKLISPKKRNTKKFIKFLLKNGQKAVRIREQSKSELVMALHKLRLAYRTLAKLMVEEGLLTESDLIKHLSHYEVKQIINGNTEIVIKAVRRKKLYKQWSEQKFPEICYGYPKTIEENREDNSKICSTKQCRGTAVCHESVKARACVINSLHEIGQLKEGDILITHSTDIAWSPYFPIISGIITELGGLISHGAVVAREYGLPCLVGVKDATKIFKTGDIVYISGKNSIVELVE